MNINLERYLVKTLTLDDSDTLQNLYERCSDYSQLIDGEPPAPTAARDEFSAVPQGKSLDDKFMFGLFCEEVLVGLLESVRHYPDDKTWWLGLLLLAPSVRGRGVGEAFFGAFERYVTEQRADRVMLSVVEANARGFRFWQRQGFDEVRKTESQTFGSKTHTLFVMKKDLS